MPSAVEQLGILKDILVGAAGNAAWFVIGLASLWIYRTALHNIPLRLLFGLKNPKTLQFIVGSPLGIIPGTLQLVKDKGMPIFGLGPFLAMQRLLGLLKSAYKNLPDIVPLPSRLVVEDGLSRDLVLIGFPAGNEITKRVMEKLDLPYRFADHNIVDSATGKVLYSANVVKDKVVHDYGMILRVPNPFHPQSIVFIFAGTETYGVKAATDYFALENFGVLLQAPIGKSVFIGLLSRVLTLQFRNCTHYQAIVECDVVGYYTQVPRLAAFKRLS
jgi:hypothetical protein